MNKNWLLLAILLPVFAACAADADLPAASPLKVDMQQVVRAGVVMPVDGITSAGQPDETGFKVFAESGYAAVIDIRTEGEDRGLDEKAVVEGLGMEYVTLPIGRDGISFENARTLDEMIASYDQPVLIHCASGNRVVALLALRASLDGADDEAALEAGREGGLTRLEPKVKELLQSDN